MDQAKLFLSSFDAGGGGDPGDPIGQSLRSRGPSNELTCPVVTAGARTWTWSGWVKKAAMQQNTALFTPRTVSGSSVGLRFTLNTLDNIGYQANTTNFDGCESTALFRDPSAWYHVVCQCDFGTSLITIFVNGEQVAQGPTTSNCEFSGTMKFGTGNSPQPGGTYFADVYLVEQALEPTAFGRFNANGVWVPREIDFDGNWGANGFHLTFADPNDIGKDYSGNGNDFSPTGFELADTSNPTYDLMQDSPTNNFATLNPLITTSGGTAGTYTSNANLTHTNIAANTTIQYQPTINFIDQDQVFFAVQLVQNSSWGTLLGLYKDYNSTSANYNNDRAIGLYGDGSWRIVDSGTISTYVTWNLNDWLYFAYDRANTTVTMWINDTQIYQNTSADNDYTCFMSIPYNVRIYNYNFGQQPYAHNNDPFNGDGNLTTANMPASTIANGRDHFRAITDTGANILTSAQGAFASGLWWIKDRVNANQHQLVDVMNGTSDVWQTPAGTGGHAYTAPTGESVAWCWKAGDSDVANTDGTIASTVRANPGAGFSIVQYTGNQTAGSVGHGLNGSPDFIIGTGYTSGLIPSWNSATTPAAGYIYLTGSGAWASNEDIWNSAQMTATTFGVGSSSITNQTGQLMTAYVWTAIPGYSSFGKYTGNSNSSGTFVNTGFKVAWIIVKSINGAGSWLIYDSTRDPYNPANHYLYTDLQDGEAPNLDVDFLSNGFKMRNVTTSTNTDGVEYVYAAFAENPFQSPVTAR